MSKKVVGIITASVLVLGLSVGASVASHRCDEHSKRCEERAMKCDKRSSSYCSDKHCILKRRKEYICFYLKHSDELGLNEDQIAKLKKLKVETKTIKLRNKTEAKILKMEIDVLLDAKKPDQGEIESKIDKISQLKAAAKKACINSSLKAREILTEDQYKLSKKLGKSKICPLPKDKKCDKMKGDK